MFDQWENARRREIFSPDKAIFAGILCALQGNRLSKDFFDRLSKFENILKMFSNLYGSKRKGTLTVPFQTVLPSEIFQFQSLSMLWENQQGMAEKLRWTK